MTDINETAGFSIGNPAEWVVWIDLDDTLWDFRANSHEALLELYDHLNLERFWPDRNSWIDDYHKVNSRLWDLYAKSEINRATLRHDRFFIPFTEAGMSAAEAEGLVNEADRYYLERLGVRGRLVPGASTLIDRLKKRGFRLGILSNGFREVQYNKLKSSNLLDCFDTIVLSDEIDINKPDARIYRHAESRGHVDARHSIMIGDNPDTDIVGALASGWKAIWFNPSGQQPSPVLTDYAVSGAPIEIVSSLDQISL